MECVQSSIRVNTDVLLPHSALGHKHTQKYKRFRGKTVSVIEICSELYMIWSAGFQWRLTCTLILRMSKKQNNEDSGDLLFWCVLLSDRENLSFQRDGPDESICAMSIACHQSSSVSLKKERERVKKRTRERERPTHHGGPTRVLSFNFNWFKLWY